MLRSCVVPPTGVAQHVRRAAEVTNSVAFFNNLLLENSSLMAANV